LISDLHAQGYVYRSSSSHGRRREINTSSYVTPEENEPLLIVELNAPTNGRRAGKDEIRANLTTYIEGWFYLTHIRIGVRLEESSSLTQKGH